MTNKLKIRCLFGKEDGDAKWHLSEMLDHEAWACGEDFKKENQHIADFRELTIEVDDDRVQEILGGSETVRGEVVSE